MDALQKLLDSITVNVQSSIRFEYEGDVYYVDPIQIAEARHDADFILLTHDHPDHFEASSLQNVAKDDSLFVYPVTIAETVADVVRGHDTLVVLPEKWYEDGPLEFETVPAYNLEKPFHPKDNAWVGYLFSLGDLRLYISGDTDHTEESADVSADIALVPIGGHFTMDPKEAAELVNEIAPEYVIPTHYGSMVGSPEMAEEFAELVDEGTTVVVKL